MTQRFRWERPLPGDAVATVTRVVGDHELPEDGGGERRFRVDCSVRVTDAAVDAEAASVAEVDEAGVVTVALPAGVGLARLRLTTGDGTASLWLPGPAFADRLEAALDGDAGAARALSREAGSVVALAFAAGEFLATDGLVDLLDAVTEASGSAADDLHARRYDFLRAVPATPAGPTADDREQLVALAAGLDGVDAIGDVSLVDVVADAMHLAAETPRGARAFLDDHGFDARALAERGDGEFFAALLAQATVTGGVGAAKRLAVGWPAEKTFEAAKADAEAADYWDRGEAWRGVVPTAADQSPEAFAYVLANALYWTAEVDRGDSRVDELLFDAAETAGRDVGLEWVVGHSRFERARARGHRHRTSRTHALAIEAFEDAHEVAEAREFLDPWEPAYTRAVVASNMHSANGDHDAAVAALDDGEATLADTDVPESRREEMVAHLGAQRHERRAIQTENPAERRSHLEAALERYEAVGFDRSVDRVREKLAQDDDGESAGGEPDSRGDDALGGRERAAVAARQSLAGDDRGPSLADIPALHDFLTETDPNAVGSPDPGVLPGEREGGAGGPDVGGPDDGPRDPRY
ncbi:hypothetical protein [Halobacterium rubrum]|uniref:hypothetical protein n=1 Tax=Halobacterium TaxID=2239 RepID=UPI001F4552DC|nr:MULTISPECIES: hypothetical protein [Halobacterium]MDH5020101.1 hypothetical protein [Halobacterium rubrum]